ncbi:cupin domain-containing protein [Hymenobacter negativus]|uniref:Cupin domain-containing protein n=1 Tax=Hymenobacter negativus TaxID=2795026 RepID=A0ABS3QLQ5_9BACT|nr:cupin domain-containing protein [Hymenobacter negativus]MBO2012200.1 cupin domain-containing protein [Hymenobacter negativus]
MSESTKNTAIPTTTKAATEHFVGTAWVSLLTQPGNPTDCVVGSVTFEPGARNSWHSHPAGQILIATEGAGYYQEKGRPAQLLRPGDTVTIAPGVVHWHGATATSLFTHLAIGPNSSQGVADWGTPVTDAEYQAAHA